MTTPISLDYLAEYYQLEPSLFRESDNLHRLFQAIFEVYSTQQEDFLWLSQNILNIDVAEKWHLDFIGNLVGQSRVLIDFESERSFGFEDAYRSDTFGSKIDSGIGGYWKSRSNFNKASAKILDDDVYRRVIKARTVYNSSDCTPNSLLLALNYLTGDNNNTVQTEKHGSIVIRTSDNTGLVSYFIDKIGSIEGVLPIASGVSCRAYRNNGYLEDLGLYNITNNLFELVNEDLPNAFRTSVRFFGNNLEKLTNEELPNTLK